MNDLPMWIGLVVKNKHFIHFFLNLETGGVTPSLRGVGLLQKLIDEFIK